jgi:hypothetical protein
MAPITASITLLTLPCPPKTKASESSATLYFPGKSHPTLYLHISCKVETRVSMLDNREKGGFQKAKLAMCHLPIISFLGMKIENKNQISTFEYNNLKASTNKLQRIF